MWGRCLLPTYAGARYYAVDVVGICTPPSCVSGGPLPRQQGVCSRKAKGLSLRKQGACPCESRDRSERRAGGLTSPGTRAAKAPPENISVPGERASTVGAAERPLPATRGRRGPTSLRACGPRVCGNRDLGACAAAIGPDGPDGLLGGPQTRCGCRLEPRPFAPIAKGRFPERHPRVRMERRGAAVGSRPQPLRVTGQAFVRAPRGRLPERARWALKGGARCAHEEPPRWAGVGAGSGTRTRTGETPNGF